MKKIPTKEELDNSIQQEMAEVTTRQARIDRAILRLQALRKRLSVLVGLRELLVEYEAETAELAAPVTRPAKKPKPGEKTLEKAAETIEDAPSGVIKDTINAYRPKAEKRGHRLSKFIFVSPESGWKARCKCGARLHVNGTLGLGDALITDCTYAWPKDEKPEAPLTPEPVVKKPVEVKGKPEPVIEKQVKVKGKPGPKPKTNATPVLDTGDETHGGLLQPGATAYGNFVTLLRGVKTLTESNGHKLAAFEQDPKGYTARCLHCRKVVRLSRIGTQSGLALKEMCT